MWHDVLVDITQQVNRGNEYLHYGHPNVTSWNTIPNMETSQIDLGQLEQAKCLDVTISRILTPIKTYGKHCCKDR